MDELARRRALDVPLPCPDGVVRFLGHLPAEHTNLVIEIVEPLLHLAEHGSPRRALGGSGGYLRGQRYGGALLEAPWPSARKRHWVSFKVGLELGVAQSRTRFQKATSAAFCAGAVPARAPASNTGTRGKAPILTLTARAPFRTHHGRTMKPPGGVRKGLERPSASPIGACPRWH